LLEAPPHVENCEGVSDGFKKFIVESEGDCRMRRVLWILLLINAAIAVGFAVHLLNDTDNDASGYWKLAGFWLVSSLAAIWALSQASKPKA
jgi:hypothetical protein